MVKFKDMAVKNPLSKRALIDKANSTIVTITAIAAFIAVFSLVASKALISQLSYQNRIISAKKTTKSRLQDDLNAVTSLDNAYLAFVQTPQNVIGGNPSGTGPNDGNNAKIVLDALPAQYDFPALITSVEALVKQHLLVFTSFAGTDQQTSQANSATSGSSSSSTATVTPVASTPAVAAAKPTSGSQVAMPFTFTVTGSYDNMKQLILALESSIRPMQFLTLSAAVANNQSQSQMSLTVTAQSYYQPAKGFKVGSETIK